MTYRKKLIEVALPLDAINRESAREKSIRHGHPSTLHLWWARRPLAACRAVLFASLVDDPGNDLPEEEAAKERERLFRIIKELVKWENINNEVVLQAARDEILKSTKGNPPPVLDPFCGGGSIPLEAQRLGLETYASDLNPVAVLITKALIEIPPKFTGRPPINPDANKGTGSTAAWRGASGLAADVRYYGKWMRDEAWKRIGHLYPKGPNGETIIAWLWARTVKCPNPACGAQMPLVRSFWLSKRKGREAWVEPILDKQSKTVHFEVRTSGKPSVDGSMTRTGTTCLTCENYTPLDYVRMEAQVGRMGQQLMAIIAEAERGRVYISPINKHEDIARNVSPTWMPNTSLPERALGFRVQRYGMTRHSDLFTPRQLTLLATLGDLAAHVRDLILEHSGGNEEYTDGIMTYLAFAIDRQVSFSSSLCWWNTEGFIVNTFARHALAMVWDFAEGNPFSNSTAHWTSAIDWIAEVLEMLPTNSPHGETLQLDAATVLPKVKKPSIFTDPPYYDNIGYADLSDFFYVWLRRSLGKIYPDLFSTLLTPKAEELIATPFRFDNDWRKAQQFFEEGLTKAFHNMRRVQHPDYPIAIYYAFKQTEEEANIGKDLLAISSTGWETMLQGLLSAGFQITGTWPIRTERGGRLVELGTNALASSIILVCRSRSDNAPIATRRELLSALKKELPEELRLLMNGQVAPVDLAQAVIGPGMAVFSRYSKVLEADGSTMTVRTALQEINYFLEDYLAQQEGDLDVESQFCIAWFQQYGTKEGLFGEADVLARAKNISVEGLTRMGLVDAPRGKVRLVLRGDYEDGWDPQTQSRLTAWEACQRLVWTLNENGEQDAGRLARRLGGLADQARELAYRLYSIADRKGWAEESLGYNALVASWSEVQKAAAAAAEETQGRIM